MPIRIIGKKWSRHRNLVAAGPRPARGIRRTGSEPSRDADPDEARPPIAPRKPLRFPKDKSTYYGFVKPKETHHDADLYRLYQKEANRIPDQGGKNLRVILDFELKKNLYRDFATFGAESRQEIAARHGLQVVGEKIPVPDLRIEYETREGEMARVDLELATEHYRPSQFAEKVRAGFSLYAPRSEADRLCAACSTNTNSRRRF